MKLNVEKNITSGKYIVKLTIVDISEDETAKIKKFGAPIISVAPMRIYHKNRIGTFTALDELDHEFSFPNDQDAQRFITSITERVKAAAVFLRSHEDKFSGNQEHEI